MKVLLIIFGGLFVVIVGYFLALDCKNQSQILILEYLYNLKCGPQKKLPDNERLTLPSTTQTTTQISNIPIPSGQQNLSQESGIKLGLLYDKPIVDYFIKQNGEVIIVDEAGKIIKLVSGQEEVINESASPPKNALFTNDGSKIVFIFPNLISIFDLTTKNWRQISEEIIEVALSPKNELAYLKKDGSIFKLDITKDNFTPQKIIQINNLDSYLLWKNDKELFIVSRPSSLNVGIVLLLNTKNKDLSLIYELPGLSFSWDSKFDNGLLFSADQLGRGGKIFWVNKDFQNIRLSFITIPSKCIFGEKLSNSTTSELVLICGIPQDQSLLKDKILLDDWLSYDLYTEDDIYQINLKEGFIEPILINQQGLDIDQVKLYKNGLSFINRFDKKLYFISLPF